MNSRTETALQALFAAIDAASAADPALPRPVRNAGLPERLIEGANQVERHLNLWDGSHDVPVELLGSDVIENAYEIEHRATIVWAVAAPDQAARDAAFDAGLVLINASLKADRTLGGAVDRAGIERLDYAGNGAEFDGLPDVKAVEITVRLDFLSSDPF